MSSKRDKTKEVFVELVNLQLKPHNKTYEDVVGDPEWYMKYNTTREAEKVFQEEGVKILREKLRMGKKMAQQEMSWFILQWGLTTNETLTDLEKESSDIVKLNNSEKGD
jgi:hypothetical protein